jgi:hypothetical protein
MKVFDYTAVVWKETEGYVSKCPDLGVASCGDFFEEGISKATCVRQKKSSKRLELPASRCSQEGVGQPSA